MEKIRILNVNSNYLTSKLHQSLMDHLDQQKYISKVFVPTTESSAPIDMTENEVIISKCIRYMDRYLYFVKNKKIVNSILTSVDLSNIHLIHAHTLFTDGYVAYQLHKRYHIPYIVAVRGTDVNYFYKYRKYLRGLGEKILINAAKVVFLSNPFRDKVLAEYVTQKYEGQIAKKCYVIPNGIDDFWHLNENKFDKVEKENRIRQRKMVLIYAGRIDKNKNLLLTVDMISKLIQENWNIKYIVVGRNEDDGVFKQLIRNSFVEYHTQTNQENLLSYYRKSDIFIMPSKSETFGLVYAEAMSQGLPVIYTRGQGFDGQYEEGVVGYSVSANRTEDIIRAIEQICNNYVTISRTAKEKSRDYRWSKIARIYEGLYSDICER